MKQAIVLGAGKGKRLGALGEQYPKIALPIGNRPLYELHIDMLKGQGITDLIFVLAPHMEKLRDTIERYVLRSAGMTVRFVVQEEPRGIGHAVNLCRVFTDPVFLLLLGDTFFQTASFAPAVRALLESEVMAVLSVRAEKDPEVIRRECTIAVDERGHVIRIVEKPHEVLSELKPCGIYFFRKSVHDMIDATPPSALRGEVEITDAISRMIASGHTVATAPTVEHDINITYEKNYLEANQRYLRTHHLDMIVAPQAIVPLSSDISLSVIGAKSVVGEAAQVLRSVVLPEACVPAHAHIADTVVFPEQGR